jgi:hypothetical protein
MKAVVALAKYVGTTEAEVKEASLEQLRDLCVEIEGETDGDDEKGLVRVVAGTAFFRAGEVEEALESLGAGTDHENLEACVHSYFFGCAPNGMASIDAVLQSLCTYTFPSTVRTSPRKNSTDQNNGQKTTCYSSSLNPP